MGIVRSIQKGEQPASKFSKDAQDAAKSMKKGSVKKYAKTKHDDLPTKKIKEGAYKSATKNELAQYIINLNNMLKAAKSKKMEKHIKFIQQDIADVKAALAKKKNESVDEKMNYVPAKFSNPEAKSHMDNDVRRMSKHLGKASYEVIKIMMDGVKSGKYDALDIVRGIETGEWNRTHEGERPFMKMLWRKVRDKFRKYSINKGKLRK